MFARPVTTQPSLRPLVVAWYFVSTTFEGSRIDSTIPRASNCFPLADRAGPIAAPDHRVPAVEIEELHGGLPTKVYPGQTAAAANASVPTIAKAVTTTTTTHPRVVRL
jgi:hypothetical protein